MLGIVLTHRSPVLLNHGLGPRALANDVIPAWGIKGRHSFLAVSKIGVVVHRQTIDGGSVALHRFEETVRPPQVEIFGMSSRTNRHQERLGSVCRKLCNKSSVKSGVL